MIKKSFEIILFLPYRKEELEKYRSEQNKPAVPDSDVLKMLQNTKIQDSNQQTGGFSKLQDSLNNEGLFVINENYRHPCMHHIQHKKLVNHALFY